MTATTSDFPSHWPLQRLGEILAFANGVNADKSSYGKGCRFINVLETITYSHIRGPEVPGRVTLPSAVVDAYTVEKGDIVFNRTSETDADVGLASAYIGEERVVFGGFVIRGRPVKNAFDPTYAGYALRAPFIRSQVISMGQGAVRSNIGQESLKRVVVPVPPAKEQRAIAKALSDVDTLLARLDRLIVKKRDLKQAVMQQLLTGQTRLSGFNRPWQRKPLREVLAICHGKSQGDVDVPDGPYPILATGGQIGTASKALYDKPSVLIGRKGTINQPQYMDTPFWTVDTLFYSAMKARHCAKFFYYRFCLIDWMQFNEASGVPSLSARTIEKIEVDCPEPEEQMLIAATLSDMDDELAAIESRRNKTRALKQAMMQELLTGRIRLI